MTRLKHHATSASHGKGSRMLFQVSQERFRGNSIGVAYCVKSLWLDAPTHEAANRAYRAAHALAPGDWTLVKCLEGNYNSKIFNTEAALVD